MFGVSSGDCGIVDLEIERRLIVDDDEEDVRAASAATPADGKYQTEEKGECFCHFVDQ